MRTNVREILYRAREGGYAVGAFNVVNLETAQAVLSAAAATQSPVVVQMTEKSLDYAGEQILPVLVGMLADTLCPDIPVGIHLDHGKTLETVKCAVESGIPSAMIDGSRHSYVENVSMTREVVKFCHSRGVPVQGEIGNVPYSAELSGETVDWDAYMTDPDEAVRFVAETNVDTLAVAVGNAHGLVKERSEPDYDRLERIRAHINVPIVMHGASDWEGERVRRVIEIGVSCFNVDTATRTAFLAEIERMFQSESPSSDIRNVLGKAREAFEGVVREKMMMFGSAGKA